MRCEIFSGYRNDRQHWHLQDPGVGGVLTYSELARDVQFWENGICFKTIHRDFVFNIKGSYAAFGRGSVFERFAQLDFTAEQPHFHFSSHGFAADTSGYIGLAVNLTPDRTYKVIIIPLLGLSAHFEQLWRQNGSPSLYEGSAREGLFTMHSSLPNKLHQTWYGLFLGGGFQIEPGGRLVLQAGYSYHWLRCKFKTHLKNIVDVFNNDSMLLSDTVTTTKVSLSDGGNMGHTGWAQVDLLCTQLWRFGLGAQIHYFSSRVLDASLHQNKEILNSIQTTFTTSSSEKFKLRWTSISGYLQGSREF